MTEQARSLFNQLRAKVIEIDNDIIELAEPHSVSYHGPEFFLEVLPRKNFLSLLLALDFNEVGDPQSIAKDASRRTFFVYAQYDGDVYIHVWNVHDIDRALPIIRQAHALNSG